MSTKTKQTKTKAQPEATELERMGHEPLPDYLRPADGKPRGLEHKGESVIMPRIKVIQAMSDEELVDEFGAGAILMGDSQVMLCDAEGSFVAVPVYQFPSFESWKDVNDKSADSPIEQTTLDPNSAIAAKAKARATEDYGQGFTRVFVESINIIVLIEATGELAILSYSRGSAKIGRRLQGYLRRTNADIYAHRVEFYSDTLKNNKGRWFVANFRSARPAWVTAERHASLAKVFDDLDKQYRAGSMSVSAPAADVAHTGDDDDSE